MVIARAGKDHPVLNQYLDLMVKEGLAANMELDIMNHPNGRHNFDVESNEARSREIIARTLSFLKTHIEVQREDKLSLETVSKESLTIHCTASLATDVEVH